MPTVRRPIPALPDRPRSIAIVPYLWRSYPVGRQEFSRAVVGQPLKLSFWTDTSFPKPVLAVLDTTLNAPRPGEWVSVPFEESDDTAFTCSITPTETGLYSFRARCSFDGGMTWMRDPVPDAWVLVDPAQIDGLRLYTMIPAASGSIQDWTNDLPRIKAMGFSAIHLLPVTTLDVSQSPYAAGDLFDVDHRYLMDGVSGDGLSQLEGYVQRACELKMGLCFDLVLNHIGVQSAMVKRAPEWIVPDSSRADGNKRARYWADGKWRAWEDLVLINYEHPSEIVRAEVWAYMIEYALFWAKYADATGSFVRFDNLHSGNPRFVEAVTRALREAYPSLAIIAEYFTDEGTLLGNVPDWRLNLVMAMPWNYAFAPRLRAYLQYLHRISDHVRYFMPITSHDSGSPAEEFGGAESTVPRYVAAALLGTGATGIVQGVESGVGEKVRFIGPGEKQKREAQPRFAKFLAAVNALLAEHDAFRTGSNCQFVDHGHDAIIAAYRRNPGLCFDSRCTGPAAEGGFLVVCNFDTRAAQRIEIDLARELGGTGRFIGEELLAGTGARYDSERFTLTVPSCGAMVVKFARR
ncbi:MAG: alpha-amylase family glycosyl hydrolase [Phycisphaerales bacterium]